MWLTAFSLVFVLLSCISYPSPSKSPHLSPKTARVYRLKWWLVLTVKLLGPGKIPTIMVHTLWLLPPHLEHGRFPESLEIKSTQIWSISTLPPVQTAARLRRAPSLRFFLLAITGKLYLCAFCHISRFCLLTTSSSIFFFFLFFLYLCSTNFCNIHDLYCAEDGCQPFTKLSYEETSGKCTEESPEKCIA